ncbi:hypothetical protein AN191_08660 [Loktanella sp. 5RATIMAR09]|nr:hypothetical protein AN191_08660 [Loktanella sp. 5RATIMAR09]
MVKSLLVGPKDSGNGILFSSKKPTRYSKRLEHLRFKRHQTADVYAQIPVSNFILQKFGIDQVRFHVAALQH